MPLNWKDNYWIREPKDSLDKWKVYLKTDVRDILVDVFEHPAEAIAFIIKDEAKIYADYDCIGGLVLVSPQNELKYLYKGRALYAKMQRLPRDIRDSGIEIYVFRNKKTKETFLVDTKGIVRHQFMEG